MRGILGRWMPEQCRRLWRRHWKGILGRRQGYRPDCLEHYVLHQLRNDPAFVPELDFVMTLDGQLIGQNMFMKAVIAADDGRSIPIMTMGPICIAPELKRKQRHLIESSCIWRRKNFWDRFSKM